MLAACGSPTRPSPADPSARLRLEPGAYAFQVVPADAPGASSGWLCVGTGDGAPSPVLGATVALRLETSGPAAWTGRPPAGDALDDFLLTLASTDPRGNGLEGVMRGSAASLVLGVRLVVGTPPSENDARLYGRLLASDRAEGTIQGTVTFRSGGTACVPATPSRWVLARM